MKTSTEIIKIIGSNNGRANKEIRKKYVNDGKVANNNPKALYKEYLLNFPELDLKINTNRISVMLKAKV